jgi:hypothetical protein
MLKRRLVVMVKKVALFALMALLLAVLPPASAAQEEVGIPIALDGSTYYVDEPGQVGVLHFGWAACNRGLLPAFINATDLEVYLDDQLLLAPDQADDLWGPFVPFTSQDPCIPRSQPYLSRWRYVLAGLGPGEYELRSIIRLTHPLPDGWDVDGDGKPEVAPFDIETMNTIIVQ